jgi:hypothetical protein
LLTELRLSAPIVVVLRMMVPRLPVVVASGLPST